MKKVMKYILVVLIIVSMLSATAMAKVPSPNNPNASSSMATVSRADYQKLVAKVTLANATIVALVRVAQLTPWNDIKWLLAAVDIIVAEVTAYAESIGAGIACEYTSYYIDGQYVLIDPLLILPVIIYP